MGGASSPVDGSSGRRRGRAGGGSSRGGEDENSLEEIQASIEELLGMQGLGSGSWNNEPGGGVPAAVEREQRTLVREIKALGRRGRWGDVLEVVARARHQGTELNSIIYGCAMNAVGRSGRYKECMILLEWSTEDIEPDEYCYKAAIIACSAANQWGRALDLFRRFQRATDGIGGASPPAAAGAAGDNAKGFAPGTAIYNAVITACARGLFTEEALAFFLEMGERGVRRDEVTYTAAIDACARGGLWQRGLDLLSEMRTAGLRPSLASYNAALDGCGREGRWEEAADLIDAMRGNDAQEDDDHDLAEILLLLDEERPDTPPSSPPASAEERQEPLASNHSPTTATAKGGSPDGVEFRVAALSSLFSPPSPDVRSYNSCIAACRRGGQSGLARLFFHDMLSRGLRPDVWTFKCAVLGRLQAQPPTPPPAPAAAAAATKAGTRQDPEISSRPGFSGGQERLPPSRAPQQARSPWRALLVLLEDVDGEGLGPDPPCINLALTECARAGRWEESRSLLEDLREASPPGGSLLPGVSRYNSVLRTLRNAPARDRRTTLGAPTAPPLGGEVTPAGGGGSRIDEEFVDLEAAGGRWSGAEGWADGHVSGFLEDMRAAGVTPDRDTYQCAIRCATDAALLDIAKAEKAAAEEAAVGKGGTVARGSDKGALNRGGGGGVVMDVDPVG
ncbi:conserved unknown protein [Ectocarpus siliculosus]|uniref:Pentacotripeptide-repeat region of PRORP domain-containing protein n=1 Tax=Ectocarpus siliculosus TaxID=2880 RepID=D8LDQ5_ECTSI|nr:conserved unknown protein [Ectocarpus siliculosus]|eukprot:CBN78462.1 conserved unknown protein [Ectocarpus siliculosus]